MENRVLTESKIQVTEIERVTNFDNKSLFERSKHLKIDKNRKK